MLPPAPRFFVRYGLYHLTEGGAPITGSPSSRRDRFLVRALVALLFAGIVALALTAEGPLFETCSNCGTTLEGTICEGSAPGSCGNGYAIGGALAAVLSSLCVVFGLNAMAAYRLQRGMPVSSLLVPEGRTGPILLQVAGVSLLAAGTLFAASGFMMPWFRLCIEPCLGPPPLTGIPLLLVFTGGTALIVGVVCLLAGRRPSRSDPS